MSVTIIRGNRGSGKTTIALALGDELLHDGTTVCILDDFRDNSAEVINLAKLYYTKTRTVFDTPAKQHAIIRDNDHVIIVFGDNDPANVFEIPKGNTLYIYDLDLTNI
jgi:DNA-binding beta-propeller fold protein YncE